MEIIVGKQGNQKITITDSTVSRKHCKLTEQSDGTFVLEDLGSTNGTYVNGQRIIKTIVSRSQTITLGTLDVTIDSLVGPKPKPEKDYTQEFKKLKSVYDNYHNELLRLEKSERLKNFYRSLPPTISTAVFALTLLLDGNSAFAIRAIMGVISVVFIIWATAGAFKSNQKTPEERQKLHKQFQIDYVCPKCKRFLGDVPYENLKNMGAHDICKCVWVKK